MYIIAVDLCVHKYKEAMNDIAYLACVYKEVMNIRAYAYKVKKYS